MRTDSPFPDGAGLKTVQHTPARQCVACEGFCLRAATVDEANTALAVAGSLDERILAAEALSEAARIMVVNLMRVRDERRAKASA